MKKFLSRIVEEFTGGKASLPKSSTRIFRLTGLFLIFLNQLFLARLIGAKGFGDYTVIFTWINLIIASCMLGFDTSVFSLQPATPNEEQLKKLKGFMRFSKQAIILLSILCSVLMLILLINNSVRYGVTFSETLFWALLLLPFLALSCFYSAVLQALQRIKSSLIPLTILLPVSVSVACFVYYKLHHDILKVDAAMFICLCCTLFVFMIISRMLKKYLRQLQNVTEEYNRREWVMKSLPHLAVTVFNFILKRSDVLFISYYFGNTRAGIYAVAYLLASLIPVLISIPESRYIMQFRESKDDLQPEKWNQLIMQSGKSVLSFILPVALIIIVFGKFILQLFGTAFIAAYVPLIILIIGLFYYYCYID